jgi:hypothetical protein
MAVMTTPLTFAELEELVRADPELDVDEALEYADWLTESIARHRGSALCPGRGRRSVKADP